MAAPVQLQATTALENYSAPDFRPAILVESKSSPAAGVVTRPARGVCLTAGAWSPQPPDHSDWKQYDEQPTTAPTGEGVAA